MHTISMKDLILVILSNLNLEGGKMGELDNLISTKNLTSLIKHLNKQNNKLYITSNFISLEIVS